MPTPRRIWQNPHMHLSKRKAGAGFTALGSILVGEGFGLFGEAGPPIQVVIGFVLLGLGIWFAREWWRSHKRIFRDE